MTLVLTNDVPRRWVEVPDGGGVADHGQLLGLGDDDHPQYTTDAEVSTTLAGYQPAGSYQVTTEKDQANGYAGLDGAGQFAPTKVKYATAIDRGAVLIAGDLGGSGSVPTVPGLATKETSGAASAAITTHVGAPDPHTQYSKTTHRHPGADITVMNPIIHIGSTSGFQTMAVGNGAYVDFGAGTAGARTAQENTHPALFAVDNTVSGAPGLKALVAMRARLIIRPYLTGGSAVAATIQANRNSSALPLAAGTSVMHGATWKGDAGDYPFTLISAPLVVAANDVFRLHFVFPNSSWGTTGYNGTWMELERLGDS